MLQAAGLAGDVPRGFEVPYLGKTCLHFWDIMQNDVHLMLVTVTCHQEPRTSFEDVRSD